MQLCRRSVALAFALVLLSVVTPGMPLRRMRRLDHVAFVVSGAVFILVNIYLVQSARLEG
jgi:hypothetical protein